MADEDSVATQRIIELAQENELLLQDVEEYRKNEDDYIAKITALQKYVVNYKNSQKKVEELTGAVSVLDAQVEELKSQLSQERAAAAEASEKHATEFEAARAEHEKEMEELKSQCMATFKEGKESHESEIQALKDTIAKVSSVETADQYFDRIGSETRDLLQGYELYMKNMRTNVAYEGIPWPLQDNAEISWSQLPVPTLIKKRAPEAGYSGVTSMVSQAFKPTSLGAFSAHKSSDPKGPNPVRDIISALLDAELQIAYYYMTIQKLAAAATGDSISLNRSGTASSGAGGGSTQGSVPSTARSGAPGKGLSLWA